MYFDLFIIIIFSPMWIFILLPKTHSDHSPVGWHSVISSCLLFEIGIWLSAQWRQFHCSMGAKQTFTIKSNYPIVRMREQINWALCGIGQRECHFRRIVYMCSAVCSFFFQSHKVYCNYVSLSTIQWGPIFVPRFILLTYGISMQQP